MPSGHHHLTFAQRCRIETLPERGDALRSIARAPGCHVSTISREVKRNTGRRGYRMKQAHRLATERRHVALSVPRKMIAAARALVEETLALRWGPEQISGCLRLEGLLSVSATWIDRHIRADRAAGGTLCHALRRRGKTYNRRGRMAAGRGLIPNRVDIRERAAVVDETTRIGDREVDPIIGSRHRGAVVSVVDRVLKDTCLELVAGKTAAAVGDAIRRCLTPFAPLVQTLTADNGKAFAGHQALSEDLSAGFFFATPYHSRDRGLNAHTNGLVRQYFDKTIDFRTVEASAVHDVEHQLKTRPRRVPGDRTPAAVFGDALRGIGVLLTR